MLLFFFEVFINRLPKIHRSVLRKITIDLLYFWDVYDVNLWQKLAITVKLCIIETRLKQGYDLQSYLVKTTRETINVLAIAEVFCKKGVFKIWKKVTAKTLRLWPVTLLKKKLCYKCLNFVKLLRTPFLTEHHRWLHLPFSLK